MCHFARRCFFLVWMLLGCWQQPSTAAKPLEVLSVLQDDRAFSRAHDVEVQGPLAFFTGKGGSVAVVDVSQPEKPRLVWSQFDPQKINDGETVLPVGTHLLLGTNNLHALDFSNLLTAINKDPRAETLPPVEFRGAVPGENTVRSINGMVKRGDYLIAACKHGWITVFDISEIDSPKLRDSYPARDKQELRSPHDIATWDDYIAVVDQSRGSPANLGVYRVADPKTHMLLPAEEWKALGFIRESNLDGANRVMVSGGYIYIACSQRDNWKIGIVDARDPEKLKHLHTLPFAGQYATGLEVSGKVIFVAGGNAVQVLDISDPHHPRELAVLHSEEIFPAGGGDAHDLVYRDGLIYVTGQESNTAGIIRVNDPKILELASAQAHSASE